MNRIDGWIAATLLFASLALAQSRPPVPIEPLLQSNQPRLIALGAWEVIKRAEDSQTNLLIDLAERWDPAQQGGNEDGDWHDAMTAVLDALIQRKVTVSPAAVLAVSHTFPDQALILVTRMNPYDAEPLLRSWYDATRERSRARVDRNGENLRLLGRIAAMMLARDHPEEIAASVLADSVEQLAVSVADAGSGGLEHCLVDCEPRPYCREETASEPQTGWPSIFQYTLEENDPNIERRNGILIYEAGDAITWRRVLAEVHQDYCYSPAALTPTTRHRLLAEMLHVRDVDIPWGPQMNLMLNWNSDDQFLRDLAKRVSGEENRLQSTVQALHAKGLLTQSQLDTNRPRLAVVVFDDRQSAVPPKPALPTLQVQDSRTSCHLWNRR
jgi:hypothetical protein